MNPEEITEEIKINIHYKIKKIEALCKQRGIKKTNHINEILYPAKKINEENSILNQALSDAILNSMASLIDYYCIFCMLKIGIPKDKIRKIQYRPINNKFLIEKSTLTNQEKKKATIETLKNRFNVELSKIPEAQKIKAHEYWIGFLGSAISHALKDYGALDSSQFELVFRDSEGRLEINQKVEKYYFYMRPLFCNPANSSGVKYNIYIDINNFLKHNAIPYLSTRIETLQGEHRAFSYFKINKNHNNLLKDGILKNLVTISFEELKANLESKSHNRADDEYLCELERAWGLGRILTIDHTNGYIDSKKDLLHFYIDDVLISKGKSATLIDANKSLLNTLHKLIIDIKCGLDFLF